MIKRKLKRPSVSAIGIVLTDGLLFLGKVHKNRGGGIGYCAC